MKKHKISEKRKAHMKAFYEAVEETRKFWCSKGKGLLGTCYADEEECKYYNTCEHPTKGRAY